MKSLITGLGRFALFLASAALLTLLSVFVLGAYALTWPIFRLSPRDARVQSVMGLAAAGMAVMRAYTPEKPGESPEDPSKGTDVPGVTDATRWEFSEDRRTLTIDGRTYVMIPPLSPGDPDMLIVNDKLYKCVTQEDMVEGGD